MRCTAFYIAVDGSTMAGITATGGVFEVQGDITVTGDKMVL